MSVKGKYDYDGLVHNWHVFNEDVHTDQLQELYTTTANYRLHFEGPKLYSYTTCIAIHYGSYILLTDQIYSKTTSRHRNHVLTLHYPIFIVPKIEIRKNTLTEHKSNIISRVKKIVELVQSANKKRLLKDHNTKITLEKTLCIDYIDHFKLQKFRTIQQALIAFENTPQLHRYVKGKIKKKVYKYAVDKWLKQLPKSFR